MSYFSMFPEVIYDSKGNDNYTLFKNIFRRVKLSSPAQKNIMEFDYYDVQDGETPEMIAYKYYGDAELHWVVLVINDVTDYYSDWPKSVQTFEQYVKDKYTNPAGIHHYEIEQTSGDTTEMIDVGMNTTDYPSAFPVSNYQYEQKIQDKIRQIRLIQPQYIEDFVEEFEKKLKEGA